MQKEQVYRNNLKNRDLDKEAPQNLDSERETIAQGQGASENPNFGVKPTQPKTDSLGCFGMVEVSIDRLGINGEGVGRLEGLTLFVDGALPGEKVRARVYETRKSFARAEALSLLSTSAHRVTPVCSLFGKCGGCQLMHLDYTHQLEAKTARVRDALQRIAKIDCTVLPCIASPQPLFYRNKIQLPVSADRRLGLYARNTHDLVELDGCAIHCPLGEKAFQHVQRLLKNEEGIDALKTVLIKTAVHKAEVLVILVTKNETPLTAFAQKICDAMPEIKGVVQNINPSEGNVILGRTYETLVGQGWIEEELCGLTFKVSPASFFQVNPGQAEALYNEVIGAAGIDGNDRVLDAYCGVGTLSLICARVAHEVVGIEVVAEAIVDASENAERNGISNAQFICGPAEVEIAELGAFDVAIVNPPRKGCEKAFLEALVSRRPKRIVYVSCDPATLARDLQFLTEEGYAVDRVQPFDMFPQTMHVECVAKLSLRDSF